MTLQIRKNLATPARLQALAPHAMPNPIGITVHNTGNDATACAEIRNVINNNPQTSFHFAVDDVEAIQGIPLNRNTWHASDGNGPGNRQTISVEICFSRSGGTRFTNAERNGARLVARLLRDNNWTVRDVYTHQHWDPRSQRCPQRTLDLGWQRFLSMVQAELNALTQPATPPPTSQRTHIVRSGENLTVIGRQFNVSPNDIARVNNLSNPNQIRAGQVLIIPSGSTAPTTPVQNFFPRPTGNPSGIVAALKIINVDSSFANRLRIANANGIANYTGTAQQNTRMLNSLRQGLLIRP